MEKAIFRDSEEKFEKIGIIGGSGFVGKNYLSCKDKSRRKIVILENKTKIKADNRHTVVKGNLLNFVELEKFIKSCDTILNFSYIGDNLKANKNATFNLINLCEKHGVKKILHLSTCEVFGTINKTVVNEETLCSPINKYQKNKKIIEEILLKNSKKTRIIILRPTVIFGKGGKNLKKICKEIRNKNIFYVFLKSLLFKNRRLNLLSINYLCEAINCILEKKFDKNEIFIISQDKCINNNYGYLLEITFKFLGKNIIFLKPSLNIKLSKLILFLFNLKHIRLNINFDNTKLNKIGFKSSFNFEDDLKKYIKNVI